MIWNLIRVEVGTRFWLWLPLGMSLHLWTVFCSTKMQSDVVEWVCNFEWKLIYMQDFFKSPQLLAESKYFIFVRKSWENSFCLQLPSPSDGSTLLSDSQFISLRLRNSKLFLRNIVDTLFKYLFFEIH